MSEQEKTDQGAQSDVTAGNVSEGQLSHAEYLAECQLQAWYAADHECGGRERGVCGLCDIKADSLAKAFSRFVRAASAWQPIASAPKDGRQILLWIVGIEPRPRIAYWSERGSDSGWYGLQSQHFIGLAVTHWMPLPSPPVVGDGIPEREEH